MNWKLKATILNVLSRVPAGSRIYLALQRRLRTNRLDSHEAVTRAAEVVELIRESGVDPSGKTHLEIGTGWRPYIPFLLSLLGAERIRSLDVNPWLDADYALETHRGLGEQLAYLAERLGVDHATLQARHDDAGRRGTDLARLLDAYRVDYACPADARNTGLDDGSIDIVFSSNVLPYIPPEVLRSIHDETYRVLKPDGLAVHRIALCDEFAIVDASITSANFLRFSEREWRRCVGSGLAYNNRLRSVQHRELLEQTGFDIVIHRTRLDPKAFEAIQAGTLPVHPEFAGLPPEELATFFLWIVGRRPNRPARTAAMPEAVPTQAG